MPKTNVFDTAARRIPIVRRTLSVLLYEESERQHAPTACCGEVEPVAPWTHEGIREVMIPTR